MSRTFSKILVICAMVAIIPLMIVGTAFAAYHSVDTTIVVEALVDHEIVDGTSVNIKWGEKEDTKHTITAGHTTEEVVMAVWTKEAYNFIGWFKGDRNAYELAQGNGGVQAEDLVKTPTLTINMEEETSYLALFEIVRYNVAGWDYKANPEQDAVKNTAPNGVSAFVYGDELPTPSNYKEEGGVQYNYEGWQIKDDATNRRYKNTREIDSKYSTAVENPQTLTLVNPWMAADRVVVNFHVGDEVRREEVLKGQPMAAELFNVANTQKGYEYHWEDASGRTVSSLTPDENTDLYLKQTEIEYTATVEGVEGEGTYSAANVTFSVEDKAALEAVFNPDNWTMKYVFWKMDGLTFNGAKYTTADEFVAAFLNADMPADAKLTLVTHKYFTEFEFTTVALRAGNARDAVLTHNVYEMSISESDLAKIQDYSVSGNSTSTLNDTIFLGHNASELKTKVNLEERSIDLKGFAISVGSGLSDTIEVTELELNTMTINDLLNKYFESNPLVALEDTITIAKIEVQFVIAQ